MWLKPPPVATPASGRSHTTSAWPAAAGSWHWAGGSTLSTTRDVVLLGSVHSDVPPTPVTSGSEPGHETVTAGIDEPPLPTGGLRSLSVPVSPEDASTVMRASLADLKAWRRFSSDCLLLNASSAEPKLWEMTSARRWSTTYCSAAIIC